MVLHGGLRCADGCRWSLVLVGTMTLVQSVSAPSRSRRRRWMTGAIRGWAAVSGWLRRAGRSVPVPGMSRSTTTDSKRRSSSMRATGTSHPSPWTGASGTWHARRDPRPSSRAISPGTVDGAPRVETSEADRGRGLPRLRAVCAVLTLALVACAGGGDEGRMSALVRAWAGSGRTGGARGASRTRRRMGSRRRRRRGAGRREDEPGQDEARPRTGGTGQGEPGHEQPVEGEAQGRRAARGRGGRRTRGSWQRMNCGPRTRTGTRGWIRARTAWWSGRPGWWRNPAVRLSTCTTLDGATARS